MRALVNGDVLAWSREQSGLSNFEVAHKLKIATERLAAWEQGQEKMSLSQLEKIATLYQRPTAFFYLSGVPIAPSKPKDFRTPGSNKVGEFGREVLLAFRRAREVQSLVKDLRSTEITAFQRPFIVELGDDTIEVVNKFRDFIGFGFEEQLKQDDVWALLRRVKTLLESKGIFVLQSSFPMSEVRGFTVSKSNFPSVIVINSLDAPPARIFSLLHEYCHLLLGEDAACDMQTRSNSSLPSRVESFCNAFSAEFLAPRDHFFECLKQMPLVFREWTDEEYKQLAKKFKVSKDVVLRRLLTLNLISRSFYDEVSQQWKKERERQDKKKSGFNIPQETLALSRNGYALSGLVMQAVNKGEMTSSMAARVLKLKVQNFDALQKSITRSSL